MPKNTYRIANMFFFPTGLWGAFITLSIIAVLLVCAYVTIWTGGTHNSYLHCFYFPIIAAGMSFGFWGGVLGGLAATLLAGPYMPLSFEPLVMQASKVWLFRGMFFIGVGGLSGMGASIFRSFLESQQMRLLQDNVTGLLNLRGLKHYLDEADNSRPPELTIFLMEIHHLQDIEKVLGPDGIQGFLRQVSDRIKLIAPECLYLCHLETSGFVVVTSTPEKGNALIHKCRDLLGNNFIINGIPIFIEIYFGLASAATIDEPIASIVRKAKIAAVKAQSLKQMQSSFDRQDDELSRRSVQIIHDLNEAIINNELTLYYQPKIDLATNEIAGLEVLVRWHHPQFGTISPTEFIPLIEKTLLINPFTKWLIEHAFKQFVEWRTQGIDFAIALNFSMRNFQDESVLNYLFVLLEQYTILPGCIEIEVTETSVADNIQNTANILNFIRKHGIRIAIDDFGTGQSSLQYLCELPIDTIKIDKLFIQSMLENPSSEAVVRSAVLLGHELNLRVVAEGVETEQELKRLRKIGCDIGQGYFLAPPMPAEKIIQWIDTKKTTTIDSIAVNNIS